MLVARSGITKQEWRAHVQICPVTSGLETKMTKAGFKKICDRYRRAAKDKENQNSADPYAKWCRKCKGKIVPGDLEFIEIGGGR